MPAKKKTSTKKKTTRKKSKLSKKDIEELNPPGSPWTFQQWLFAHAYLRCRSATQAYREAGLGSEVNPDNDKQRAYAMKNRPHVLEFIRLKQAEQVNDIKWTRDWVLECFDYLYTLSLDQDNLQLAFRAIENIGKIVGVLEGNVQQQQLQVMNNFADKLQPNVYKDKELRDAARNLRARMKSVMAIQKN